MPETPQGDFRSLDQIRVRLERGGDPQTPLSQIDFPYFRRMFLNEAPADMRALLDEVERLREEKRKLRIALTAYAHPFVFDNYVLGLDTQPWLFAQAALAACPPEPEVKDATLPR